MDPIATIQTLFGVMKQIYEEIKLLQENAAYLLDLRRTLQNIEAILGKMDGKTKTSLENNTLCDIEEIARAIHDMLSKSARRTLAGRTYDFVRGNTSKQKEAILELHENLRDKMSMLHLDVSASGQKQILAEIMNMQPKQSQTAMAWKADAADITVSREKNLGSGGFANTFAGTYRSQDVAVKLPHDAKLNDFLRNSVKREREVGILFKLHHPNIVSCLGGIGADGPRGLQFCVIMEKLECTLQQAIQNSRLPQYSTLQGSMDARLKVCLGVCRGVAFLHAQTPHPMLHRDLNTNNVMLDEQGTAKIIDFGNAKEVQGAMHSTQVVATPGWIAPEVEDGDAEPSEKSDVYALGLVCFIVYACTELSQYVPVRNHRVPIEASMDTGLSASLKTMMLNCIFSKARGRPRASALVQAFTAETPKPQPQVHGPAHGGGFPGAGSSEVQLEPPLSALVSKHFPDDDDAKNITEVLIKNRYQKAAKLQQVEEDELADLFDELGLNRVEKKMFRCLYAELKGGAAESGAAASGAAESGGGGGGGGGGASKAEALRQVVAKFNITESDLDKGDPARYGYTLLHKAAVDGRVDDMRLLLQAGATVDPRNNYGNTPLMRAAINGEVDCVKLLVEAGADRNAKSKGGETALAWARSGAGTGQFDKRTLPDVERALQ